ncbi:NapC/NirT family cytochrome c [Alisedimentitalea sp. MJ-SS2]|uniref:NapC/NirT family cytochrome c n=1 Tax=Aliisedimentitalea sp. MJ-SS2 TaxID=3049795 RepID=UPI0029120359|nr:NapC/NirT family cytochrome c [Alisedimentitalea sp. MJ-SS2]MDU8929542.1 NapC/NirT family cytochrome c [Alisedimentitalea sp. MJ-SS2]
MRWFKSFWRWFWVPTARFAWGAILMVGVFVGVIFWGGLHTAMEATNTLGFCTSCHEMRQFVYEEYKKTTHYNNPSGVRATCSDCHVPKPWGPKVLRKFQATGELWGKITGKVNTKEKFEAHRWEMANRVWDTMLANDSRECRNCHSYHAMDFENQSRRAREKMQEGIEDGKTCIECHKGIAHKLPKDPDGDDDRDD